MKIYSADVRVYATAYVKANSLEEAVAKIREMDGSCLEVDVGCAGDIEISGKKFDAPDLPECSLSPAMTISIEEGFDASHVEEDDD